MTAPASPKSPLPVAQPAASMSSAAPSSTPPTTNRVAAFFKSHQHFLIGWVFLIGVLLLWKGKVAALAAGAIALGVYSVLSLVAGRMQIAASAVTPTSPQS